jgi:hypothetical protein
MLLFEQEGPNLAIHISIPLTMKKHHTMHLSPLSTNPNSALSRPIPITLSPVTVLLTPLHKPIHPVLTPPHPIPALKHARAVLLSAVLRYAL